MSRSGSSLSDVERAVKQLSELGIWGAHRREYFRLGFVTRAPCQCLLPPAHVVSRPSRTGPALERAAEAGRLYTRTRAAGYMWVREADFAHLLRSGWVEPVT